MAKNGGEWRKQRGVKAENHRLLINSGSKAAAKMVKASWRQWRKAAKWQNNNQRAASRASTMPYIAAAARAAAALLAAARWRAGRKWRRHKRTRGATAWRGMAARRVSRNRGAQAAARNRKNQ
jgi:7-keto-8-aminopelargonate synthetase-like enzyme